MYILSARTLRDLTPACPPVVARLATLMVVAALSVLLTLAGLTVLQSLVMLAAVCGFSAATGVIVATGRGVSSLLRTALLLTRASVTGEGMA